MNEPLIDPDELKRACRRGHPKHTKADAILVKTLRADRLDIEEIMEKTGLDYGFVYQVYNELDWQWVGPYLEFYEKKDT